MKELLQIMKKLVHQFTKETNTYFEFHPFHFLQKDEVTGTTLLSGLSSHGLYSIFCFQ